MPQVPVWDLPTRLVHWTLVLAVTVAYVTGGEDGRWFVVHLLAGYAVAALIVFRLGWGLFGSRHSRFGDFIYSWPAIRGYACALARLRPPPGVGHNPLGGLMALALLAVLAAVVVTGLVTGEPGETTGPLAHWAGLGKAAEEVHEALANLVLILVCIHVAAVVLDWAITGENLIAAMIHGRKRLDTAQAQREPPLVGGARALLLAGAVLALLVLAIQQTKFAALAEADGDRFEAARVRAGHGGEAYPAKADEDEEGADRFE